MKIDRIHHVAYRCKDAKETVLWYERMLNMGFVPWNVYSLTSIVIIALAGSASV